MKVTQAWCPPFEALDPGSIAFRNRIAVLGTEPCEYLKVAGHEVSLARSAALRSYSVVLRLDSPRGALVAAIECSTWLPEFSADVLRAACPDGSGIAAWLEWACMPWLDALERVVGCAFRVADAALERPAPDGAVACTAQDRDGRIAHLALCGRPLDALARAMAPSRRLSAQPWMRIRMDIVLRVRDVTFAEMKQLSRGALLRVDREELWIVFGSGSRKHHMTAHWATNESVARGGGVTETSRQGASDVQGLHALEELAFDIDVVIDSRAISFEEAAAIGAGSVIDLKRPADGRRVTLASNGRPFARGELVTVDGNLAVLIDQCWKA